MNEHLTERFGRRRDAFRRQEVASVPEQRMAMTLEHSIRQYFKDANRKHPSTDHWTNLPEIPTFNELWHRKDVEENDELELQANIVVGPYASKEQYLECHYRLIREDAGTPIYPYLGFIP